MSSNLVKWPVNDPRYEDWGCGGQYVVLAVFEDRDKDDMFLSMEVSHCENLQWDTKDTKGMDYSRRNEVRMPDGCITTKWGARHHPYVTTGHNRIWDDENDKRDAYDDAHFTIRREWDYRRLPDCVAMVSLERSPEAWGPVEPYEGDAWHCTKRDLTKKGKAVYDALDAIYPGRVRILTFWIT